MKLASSRMPQKQFDYVTFESGLDQITPVIQTRPGSARDAQNFEVDINGGYTTIQGYEIFDGQPKPSDGSYARLDVTITGSFSAGDVITGDNSGATATVIKVETDNAQDFLVITKITGTFNTSDNLEVSTVAEGSVDTAAVVDGSVAVGSSSAVKLNAQYNNLVADEYRGDISAVPGSGNILGLWMLSDVKYAFRNNAGGTACDVYKSSASGWTQVALGFELAFTSGGTTPIAEGDVITGATSGCTATVTRVVLEDGSWAAGDASGRLIFASQSTNFQAENLDVGVATNLATIAADSSAITLSPSGRFEFITHNFGGLAGAARIYGCDGQNRAFEFDGTVFAPIATGMATDTPLHIVAFENHLFLSYDGSVQHSSIGFPYEWSVVTGASELAVGDTITALQVQPGAEGNSTLAIFSRNSINMLYGTSSADWNLVDYRKEVGAYPYTVQEFGMTMMLDDRGVANLLTVQAFGNFGHNSVSRLIQGWVNERKTKVVASSIARDKSQYRLYFSDKSALYVTTDNRRVTGMMPVLFNDQVTSIFSLEAVDGSEEMFFGSTDGKVYQLDKGTSFDGDVIETILSLHFHHSGSPRVNKRYLGATMELSGAGYSEFNFSYELGYRASTIPQPTQQTEEVEFSDTRWDSFTWDAFFWDGVVLRPSSLKLEGTAENIAFIFTSSSDYFSPLTFSGVQIQMIPRRQLR